MGIIEKLGRNKIFGTFVDTLFHTVVIDEAEYIIDAALGKVFPSYPERTKVYTDGINHKLAFEASSAYLKDTSYFTTYRGVPIWIDIFMAKSARGDVDKATIKTLRNDKCVEKLYEFLDRLYRIGLNQTTKRWTELIWTHSKNGHEHAYRKLRTFDDVFITNENKTLITESIDSFRNKMDWYFENRIPYHFGILLYGEPGGGKSSLAQAIANYAGAQLNVVSGDDICYFKDMISHDQGYSVKDHPTAFLIEDIDCGMEMLTKRKSRYDDNEDDDDNAAGLATVLNTFDGMFAPNNCIYIFTTNHIENLDPALIRPGRIDLKINVGGITKETLDIFCEKHYGRKCTVDNINEKLTFAALQVDVMKGMSFDELMEKIKL